MYWGEGRGRTTMNKGELIERYKKGGFTGPRSLQWSWITGGKEHIFLALTGKISWFFLRNSRDITRTFATVPLQLRQKNSFQIWSTSGIGVRVLWKIYSTRREKLNSITPEGLDMVFFCQDGSGALKVRWSLPKYTNEKTGNNLFYWLISRPHFRRYVRDQFKRKIQKGLWARWWPIPMRFPIHIASAAVPQGKNVARRIHYECVVAVRDL